MQIECCPLDFLDNCLDKKNFLSKELLSSFGVSKCTTVELQVQPFTILFIGTLSLHDSQHRTDSGSKSDVEIEFFSTKTTKEKLLITHRII